MTDFPILRDLGFILIAAALLALAARALRVPAILGYMVAGLLLGPATHLVEATESLELISEVGIALLLFLVGLELSLDRIRDVGRVAVLAGVAQIAITAILGFALASVLGFAPLPAALLALGVTFSSTVVAVKLLHRQGHLHALYGRIAVGILLVQDVAVAITLTLLAGLGEQASLDVAAVGRGLLQAFTGMAALVLLAVTATRWILPRLFGWLRTSVEALFIWSLTWCFGFILAAQALGLSVEIGAFVAGMSLAQLPHNDALVRRVHPLVNFFLAVFFVTLGIHMEVGAALVRWPSVLALTAFVLIGKPVILMVVIPRLGYGERTGFLAALTLGQLSEFSFILASLALGAGLVDQEFLAVVGVVGLLTIGTSATLIQGGERIHRVLHDRGLLRPFRAGGKEEEEPPALEGHVVVVGMNTLGRRLVDGLVSRGERVLAIDTDPEKLRGLPRCAVLVGNTEYPSVLEEAKLANAKLLISALQIEDANNLLAYQAHRAGVPSSIHAFDPVLIEELRENGASHLMISKHDGVRRIAEALREAGVIH